MHRCKLDYQIKIIRLNFCLMRRLVAYYAAASLAAMDYYIAALGVGDSAYRAQDAATFISSVSRIYINVQ